MSKTPKPENSKDNVIESFKDMIPLSFGEEIGNATSHGVAALLTLFILPYAAVHSYIDKGTLSSISVSIYIISIFMMFISSTVYHSMNNNTTHKYILRIIDHSMIYVAIAGTYTPVMLTVVGGWIGWIVFILLWGTTIWGVLYKSLSVKVNQKLSLIVYLVMGWVGIIFLPIIFMRTSWLFLLFIVLGGLAYTIGAWFYAQKNRPYFHMIWHIFIVLASLLHLIGILYFM
ncbi:hemolysin III family protein [Staphylococcus devriesei]|uniref:Hemolysin III n=1 Tax=Staphylococcus devriesei TaxID=586733 RepID=A0A2K4DRW0_9STAP|nr:hemolysin III family protein [Staphylococcus devriesei]MCE5089967.1 hemolysin III family protein [Staphylococcus devriesei]MCE5097944.1 hemolysin III family protein [Staphylococcus devriesei]PNZ89557.1 hemolysin III [Staphylococcus devriesei]PTE74749.1 hemolysin III [Staphylococcus devriesei]PTF04504.1 hemolysin III [Staphylococcus devriesei]